MADLLKDNDNKTIIYRPDTTTSSPVAATTISPSMRNLANDTAVNSSPPTHTESTLVETMTPGQQKPPEDTSSQKIQENNTVTSIDNITTITPTPNVTKISNSSISTTSPSSFINETQKIIENSTTSSIVNDLESKKQEINQTKIEQETEKPTELSTEQNKIKTNASVTTLESVKTVNEKNESTDLAKNNQTKLINEVLNVTESSVTQNTPTIQINVTIESITTDSETTKEISHPTELSPTTSQEVVAHPAEATETDQVEIIPGGINHTGEAQRLENQDPPASGGFLEPGMTAGIMVSIFVGVAIFGYIGLILWRKMLE